MLEERRLIRSLEFEHKIGTLKRVQLAQLYRKSRSQKPKSKFKLKNASGILEMVNKYSTKKFKNIKELLNFDIYGEEKDFDVFNETLKNYKLIELKGLNEVEQLIPRKPLKYELSKRTYHYFSMKVEYGQIPLIFSKYS